MTKTATAKKPPRKNTSLARQLKESKRIQQEEVTALELMILIKDLGDKLLRLKPGEARRLGRMLEDVHAAVTETDAKFVFGEVWSLCEVDLADGVRTMLTAIAAFDGEGYETPGIPDAPSKECLEEPNLRKRLQIARDVLEER